jgi:hypothetical protein
VSYEIGEGDLSGIRVGRMKEFEKVGEGRHDGRRVSVVWQNRQ